MHLKRKYPYIFLFPLSLLAGGIFAYKYQLDPCLLSSPTETRIEETAHSKAQISGREDLRGQDEESERERKERRGLR